MNLRQATRLKRNALVLYSERARGMPTWWGRVVKVTAAGGVLVSPARWHWHDGPPPPTLEEEMLQFAWNDIGPEERWIPAAKIYKES